MITLLPSVPVAITDAARDAALVLRFKNGDELAFAEIMTRHRSKVFSLTLRMLHNHTDAEEITQDTFIRAHRNLVNFRGDSALGTWLHRIATNLSHNRYWYFFRRHRQDTLSLDCAVGESNTATFSDLMAAVDRDPAQETVSNEFIALVDQCMARLDKRHHEILTLRNILDHSYQEVAVILGISVGTVKSRIARARDSLRALLTETCPEFAPGAKAMDWFLRVPALYGRPVIASA